jgi:hypothetical protein
MDYDGVEWIHLTQNEAKSPVRVSKEDNFLLG